MENKINKKINEFIENMKKNIKNKVIETFNEITLENLNNKKIEILKYIENNDILVLENSDFKKRKRSKNIVPQFERCLANRANGLQCTRRKKKEHKFCGTHLKSQPYGITSNEETVEVDKYKKITIYSQEINGIMYYIDDFGNIYDPYDIMNNDKSPKVVKKYELRKHINDSGDTIKEYVVLEN